MNDALRIGQAAGVEPWVAAVAAQPPAVGSLGVYVHVPYCASRCGYCDFNTYTPTEIDVAISDYAAAARAEIAMVSRLGLATSPGRPVDTVFFGGGTPTMIPTADLAALVAAIDDAWGLRSDAEITVEANPDSVDAAGLRALRAAGFTRVSFGVQSLATSVLAVLDRTHTPGRALKAIDEAHRAGFEHVSADLIYATPGETEDDLVRSVTAVLAQGIDHLSAYSLIVEPGTRLANRVRRGEIPSPDDDVAAHRYALIDELARAAGLEWYEVSNWSRPGAQCRHNLGYWRDGDWWAIGPGAHGHRGDVRWWNIKHPGGYLASVSAGLPPVADWESLEPQTRRLERIMLGLRLREGLSAADVGGPALERSVDFVAQGLLAWAGDRLVLTDEGRLLADGIIRELV